MRVGQNPAKMIPSVAKPKDVTVALITYIPFLGGYYAQSLDVLRVCLNSILKNTRHPYDLMVFDNASCDEVRSWLIDERDKGNIQYLVLSDKNIGKSGAWNFVFQAAPGEFIAYADSDVYHYPGWLSALVDAMETIPQIGMLTGMPLRSPEEFSTATLAWAKETADVEISRGGLLPWDDFWKHAKSLGADEEAMRERYQQGADTLLAYRGKRFYVGAGHFQFVTRKEIIRQVLPIPSNRPMGEVRMLDVALNAAGYLRLSTTDWYVQHLGNQLTGSEFAGEGLDEASILKANRGRKRKTFLFDLPPVRRFLQWLYHKLFEILFLDKGSK